MTADYYIEQYRVLHADKPWFGTGIRESLEPIPAADFHRPIGHRTIAALIGHLIAWRRNTALRIQGLPRPKIELNTPEDWPDYSGRSKEEMLTELDDTYRELVAALRTFDYATLDEKLHPDYYYTNGHLLEGAVQHDIYHLGQINLLAAILRGT